MEEKARTKFRGTAGGKHTMSRYLLFAEDPLWCLQWSSVGKESGTETLSKFSVVPRAGFGGGRGSLTGGR